MTCAIAIPLQSLKALKDTAKAGQVRWTLQWQEVSTVLSGTGSTLLVAHQCLTNEMREGAAMQLS